ncbi:sulfotransferase 6B1-like [Hyperolius riggenbachi]|uniref:sulfotransferase 6B1-like n=1 Tax=Hyperolius riggenbachi TaxID=752182 RepID=UPI0035A3610D
MLGSGEKNKMREKYLTQLKRASEDARNMTSQDLQFNYKGILYPTTFCSEATFEAMDTYEARQDDVLILTYPKCGTTWVLQILHEMFLQTHDRQPSTEQTLLEFGKPEKYEHLNQQPSPRIITSHLMYENLPKTIIEKKTKILMVLRNPKDAAVSFFHFYNNHPVLPTYESWDLFFKDFITGNVAFGSYFDFTLDWEKRIDDSNILVLSFEEMKVDLPAQLRKLSEFYGLTLTDEQIKMVQEKTSFTHMKEKSSNTHGDLGHAFFRKGEIGDWKSLFTEEQSREVDEKFEKHLAGTNLGKRINYAKYCTY